MSRGCRLLHSPSRTEKDYIIAKQTGESKISYRSNNIIELKAKPTSYELACESLEDMADIVYMYMTSYLDTALAKGCTLEWLADAVRKHPDHVIPGIVGCLSSRIGY